VIALPNARHSIFGGNRKKPARRWRTFYRRQKSKIKRLEIVLQLDRKVVEWKAIGSQSGVFAVSRVIDGRLFHIGRRWQVRMRAFRVRGCSFDRSAGGADSLLDFLFTRCQQIVRDGAARLSLFWFQLHRLKLRPYPLLSFGERDLPTP
jgi:hypothetical protein